MMRRQQLTTRLQAVYDIARLWRDKLNAGRRLIDVGSDHGYVSLEGLITNDYDFVVATDIHQNPAKKTHDILVSKGYADKSTVVCTDGLDGVEIKQGDVVIMAGLGGNNMMDILGRVRESTSEDVLRTVIFCLQPQKTIEDLRVFLVNNGFEIKDEIVVNDRDIFYPIIITSYDGIASSVSLHEKYYGPVLISKSNNDDSVRVYFDNLDKRLIVRSRGDDEIRELMVSLGKIGGEND